MALTLEQIQKNVNTRTAEYWAERALENEGKFYKLGTSRLKALASEYKAASASIVKEIRAIYANGKIVDGKLKLDYVDAIKYNRLGKTLDSINDQLKALGKTELRATSDLLEETYRESYYLGMYTIQQGVSVGTTFAVLPNAFIQNAIKTPWSGATYAERIGINNQKLAQAVQQSVTQSLIRGDGVKQAATVVNKKMGVGYSNAERLIRTEMSYVVNDANREAYSRLDFVEEYEYIAEIDDRTSEICRDLDGGIFKKTDATAGVNFPPMHPRCRSTTAAHFQGPDILGRKIYESDGAKYLVPKDMDYDDWKTKVLKGATTRSKPI